MNRRSLFAAACSLPALFVRHKPADCSDCFRIELDVDATKARLQEAMQPIMDKIDQLREDLKPLRLYAVAEREDGTIGPIGNQD